jgi:hypothetical protein
MNVMLNSEGLSDPVAAWSQGAIQPLFGLDGANLDAVLRVVDGPEGGRPECGVISYMVTPWRARYVGADGVVRDVQSFRMRGTHADERYWLYCCECGTARLAGSRELEGLGTSECGKCGALATATGCRRWHAWGVCPDCKPSVAECSAAAEKAAGRDAQRRRAEDGPPTKAGPGALSHRSAGSSGPTGGVPLAGGLDRIDVTG